MKEAEKIIAEFNKLDVDNQKSKSTSPAKDNLKSKKLVKSNQ